MEVPTVCKAYFSGLNFRGISPAKYGLKYGTFTYLHLLDPEIPIDMRYSFTQFFSWSLSRAYLGGYGGEVSLDPGSTCPNRLRYLQGSSRSAMSCHSLLRLRLQHIFNCMPAFDKYLPTFLNIYFLQHIGIANCYINVFQGY